MRTLLFLFFSILWTLPSCSESETSKALVKITNVKVIRAGEQTLQVTLDYDLAPGVKLPLPYKEVVVFPLEPQVELAGALEPFALHVGSVAVSLQIPAGAGLDWDDLNDKDTCCIVSLKGLLGEPGAKTPRYERISNEVRVLPPGLSG
ncbi:MAG: hypothetical protein ACRERD_10565 [Candidatus Binatia bacterium]